MSRTGRETGVPGAIEAGTDPRHGRARSRRLLLAAILLTASVLAVEVIGGLIANSLALLSDAGHVLTDLLALILSYTAFVIAARPANAKKSFGYYRIEILAALLNGAILLVIAGAILRESFLRFAVPEPVRTAPMVLAAGAGFVGNLIAMLVLSSGRSNLNVRGAFLHVLGDTLSSIVVLAAGFIMMATGWSHVDAVAGGVIAVVIVIGAVRLLKESADILLEACPVDIDGSAVEAKILKLPEVRAVHDLHIWSITSGMHALSGHIVVRPEGAASTDDLLGRLQGLLRDEFDITHTTLQIETEAFEEIGQVH